MPILAIMLYKQGMGAGNPSSKIKVSGIHLQIPTNFILGLGKKKHNLSAGGGGGPLQEAVSVDPHSMTIALSVCTYR